MCVGFEGNPQYNVRSEWGYFMDWKLSLPLRECPILNHINNNNHNPLLRLATSRLMTPDPNGSLSVKSKAESCAIPLKWLGAGLGQETGVRGGRGRCVPRPGRPSRGQPNSREHGRRKGQDRGLGAAPSGRVRGLTPLRADRLRQSRVLLARGGGGPEAERDVGGRIGTETHGLLMESQKARSARSAAPSRSLVLCCLASWDEY